MRGLNDLLDGL